MLVQLHGLGVLIANGKDSVSLDDVLSVEVPTQRVIDYEALNLLVWSRTSGMSDRNLYWPARKTVGR